MFLFYGLVAVLAAPSILALLNTLAMSVLERTREIGMLRAVGSTRRQIRRMVLAESLLLSAAGTGFGLLAGLLLGYALTQATASIYPISYYFPWSGILTAIARRAPRRRVRLAHPRTQRRAASTSSRRSSTSSAHASRSHAASPDSARRESVCAACSGSGTRCRPLDHRSASAIAQSRSTRCPGETYTALLAAPQAGSTRPAPPTPS